MGKTCVVKKLVAEAPGGVLAAYRDIEGLSTPAGFAERIALNVASIWGGSERFAAGWSRYSSASGVRRSVVS
jgi:hypothetical protein